MIRTALYIRVSTEEQAIHGLSLEAQDAVLSDYANKNDLVIVGRYVDIERYLLDNVVSELNKYERDHTVKAAEKKQKKNTDKAIEKIRKKLSKLKDLYVNDMIDIDEYKRDYDDLQKQLTCLTESTEEEERPVDTEAIKSLLSKSTEEIYQTLTAEDRRKFWNGFIDHIVVHSKDNMEIFFK